MIFFFGIKGKSVGTERIQDQQCVHCEQTNTIHVDIVSRYVHCFWIPVFPIGKKGYTVCSHCKQTLSSKEMPATYKTAVDQSKAYAKTPVWHYTGLIMIGLLLLMFFSII